MILKEIMKQGFLLGLSLLLLTFTLAAKVVAQVGPEAFPKVDVEKDWPWWRGISRDGHSKSQSAPTELSEQTTMDWKAPVPGRGHSSPIVVGNRVYLLTADESAKTHSVVAFDRTTGNALWTKQLNQGGFPAKNHPKNTEASPTLASDGERLYASLFHHEGVWVVALSLDGQVSWEKKLGKFNPRMYEYGYAPSPVLFGETVIVCYEYDGPSAIVALNRKSGTEVWRTPRPESISFSSPVVTNHQGRNYLLISGINKVTAYDPSNGQQLWSTQGTTMATCGTMVWDDGIVFASGGYPAQETIALDITNGQVLWRNNQKAYEQSMVATRGYLYSLTDSGVLFCWEGRTGKEKWKQRLGGPVSASGVLVGDRIYWANEGGNLWVFQATPDGYREIAKNKVGDESFASPAVCGGQVFLRVAVSDGKRQEYLMRFSTRQ